MEGRFIKHWLFNAMSLATALLFSGAAIADFKSLENFGDNPGDLTASVYQSSVKSNELVLILHGCTQNGEQLAKKSGFYQLAQADNFNLLVPQQHSKNNIKDCFNWFSLKDITRDSGELKSIVNMIKQVTKEYQKPRVFIVGLSAGGAMATSLLSQYPSLFEAGAVIAGLPFPCADNLTKAISCMRNGPSQTPKELAELVVGINGDQKPRWPNITIWTGSNDQVVNPINSQFLAKQWLLLMGLNVKPNVSHGSNYTRSLWIDSNKGKVELIELENLGHGLPVNNEQKYGGEEGAFLLQSSLPSALEITKFWQLSGSK